MARNKTVETTSSVTDFINSVENEAKRKDSFEIIKMMKRESKLAPKMWGPAIVGFGTVHYKYESGREGDMPIIGFSPRKNTLTLYLANKFEGRDELLKRLGKHTTSVACLYIKKLADIDRDVLKQMIALSVKEVKKKYPK